MTLCGALPPVRPRGPQPEGASCVRSSRRTLGRQPYVIGGEKTQLTLTSALSNLTSTCA